MADILFLFRSCRVVFYNASFSEVIKTGNGEQGTSTGNGKMKNGNLKQRIGNEVTESGLGPFIG